MSTAVRPEESGGPARRLLDPPWYFGETAMDETTILDEEVRLEPISPELALVSPELAAVARASLPEPGSAFWRTDADVEPTPSWPTPSARLRLLAVGHSIGRPVAVGAVTALAVLGLTLAADATRDRAVIANASGVLAARLDQQQITSIFLEWDTVADAAFYDIQLYEHRAKVFETRISDTRLSLPRSWVFEGVRHTLAPGGYGVYIRPSLPVIAAAPKYGIAIVRTLTVARDGTARVIFPG